MSNSRVVEVIEDLETILQQFIRKHRITQPEYRAATDLIIDSIKAGEESLLFDVFFEAEATDVVNADRQGSVMAIEGPFYFEGAPLLQEPCVMPQRPDEAGDVLVFKGSVTATDGTPIANAELDMWHADAAGLYSNIHPGVPDWNLRGRFTTRADGSFEVRTILPPPYEIPKNGPTGQVLNALGRHFYRPAHLHLKVHAEGFEHLTSQLYFSGDEYLQNDVAHAVRDGLVISVIETDEGLEGEYGFVLETASSVVQPAPSGGVR